MGNLILAFIAMTLVMMKIETSVTNEEEKEKIARWHLKISNQMFLIVNSPYSSNRERIQKWAAGTFVGLSILSYISMILFGVNSPKNPFENKTIFVCVCITVILLIGNFDRKNYRVLIFLLIFTAGIAIYITHTGYVSRINANPLMKQYYLNPYFIDAFIIVGCFALFYLNKFVVFVSRKISLALYWLTQKIFKVSLKFSKEKPLKITIGIMEILVLFISALAGLFS